WARAGDIGDSHVSPLVLEREPVGHINERRRERHVHLRENSRRSGSAAVPERRRNPGSGPKETFDDALIPANLTSHHVGSTNAAQFTSRRRWPGRMLTRKINPKAAWSKHWTQGDSCRITCMYQPGCGSYG